MSLSLFPWKRAALFTGLFILLAAFTGANVTAYQRAGDLIHPDRKPALSTPIEFGIARFDDVRFRTTDGVLIAGWYIPGESPAAVVLVHGFASNRSQLLPDAKLLNDAGLHVLTIDCRACGDSNGKANTFGYAEIEDVRGAMMYLAEQPGVDPQRIGLAGLSQGGSTVVLSGAAIPEVAAVAAISTFTSLEDNIAIGVRSLTGLPPFPFAPMVVFWGEQISGMDLQQVRPVDVIGRISPRPLLLIHGEADTLVPVENARRNFAAAGEPKELVIIPGAGHSNARAVGGTVYTNALLEFFEDALLK